MLVYSTSMKQGALRKITVEVPEDVLERARDKGEGVTEVVRRALELRASQRAWKRLQRWSGKVRWSKSLEELRED
jgi:post-segregation antitoxin (ccd killing protein)